MIISTVSSLAAHRLHIRWAGAAAAHRRVGLSGSRNVCSRWTRGVKKRIAAASHEVRMEGCPRQPPSRFQQHGRFGGVAGRSWALPRAILGAFALKLGLPGGAKWANPVLQGLFFGGIEDFEVERDAQGPCCRQDGVPLARAGPRVGGDDAPVPGGTYGTYTYAVWFERVPRCPTRWPERLRRST